MVDYGLWLGASTLTCFFFSQITAEFMLITTKNYLNYHLEISTIGNGIQANELKFKSLNQGLVQSATLLTEISIFLFMVQFLSNLLVQKGKSWNDPE